MAGELNKKGADAVSSGSDASEEEEEEQAEAPKGPRGKPNPTGPVGPGCVGGWGCREGAGFCDCSLSWYGRLAVPTGAGALQPAMAL